MTTVKMNDENIVTVLKIGSWVLLAILAGSGWYLFDRHFAVSIVAGGLLAIINFYWLHNILNRALLLPKGKAQRLALSRYFLRLAVIGFTVWILIVWFRVNLIGLIIGLSVLLTNIFALTIYRLISKGG
jgi:hypothetical protein